MAEPKFEKDLERLEEIVEALEAGGLSLDQSLKHFEEGIKLTRRCEKALRDAERKIEILTKNAEGELAAEPFGDEEDANDAPQGPNAENGKKPERNRPYPGKDGGDESEGGLLF